jgi:hypothetical protein
MIKDQFCGFYLDLLLKNKLKEIAQQEGRSLSGQIIYILRKYIEGLSK